MSKMGLQHELDGELAAYNDHVRGKVCGTVHISNSRGGAVTIKLTDRRHATADPCYSEYKGDDNELLRCLDRASTIPTLKDGIAEPPCAHEYLHDRVERYPDSAMSDRARTLVNDIDRSALLPPYLRLQ